MNQTTRRTCASGLDAEGRRMWLGWIGFVTRYGNRNLSDIAVRDGFPVEIGDFEAEYYFADSGETVEDTDRMLEDIQWMNFIGLCRTIRNGTIRSLKIRGRRPVAGRSALPKRVHRREIASILARSRFLPAPGEHDLTSKTDSTGPRPGGAACPSTPREGSDAPASSGGPRRGPSTRDTSLN